MKKSILAAAVAALMAAGPALADDVKVGALMAAILILGFGFFCDFPPGFF